MSALAPKGPLGLFVLGAPEKKRSVPAICNCSNRSRQLSIAIENHRAAAEIAALKERLGEERNIFRARRGRKGSLRRSWVKVRRYDKCWTKWRSFLPPKRPSLILRERARAGMDRRAIHRMSPRKHRPIIKVNCAAIRRGCWRANYSAMKRSIYRCS